MGIGRFSERIAASTLREIGSHLMTVDRTRGASASSKMVEPIVAITVVDDVVTPLGYQNPVFLDLITWSATIDRPPVWA